MDLTQYQKFVHNQFIVLPRIETSICCAFMGAFEQLGSASGVAKKMLWGKSEFERKHIAEELGDTLYYITAIANLYDLTLEEIIYGNVEKVNRRYPEGFDPSRSEM